MIDFYVNSGSTTDNCNWYPTTKIVKRVTRTIDKYDMEGIFIGREIVTEEYEDVERQVWQPQYPQQPWYGNDFIVTCNASALSTN